MAYALPTLPQLTVDTTYIPRTGSTITVNSGGNLQTALNDAVPGDKIVIEAGATFEGNFTLPTKSGSSYIYIESSLLANLPPNTRVSPSNAAYMPKIRSTNTSPVFESAAGGTHHYRFVGLEITTTHNTTSVSQSNLVLLQKPGGNAVLADCPTDIIFDRCYIHGTSTGNIDRGIEANCIRFGAVDCYISDIHDLGVDSQAINAFNAPGPFKIHNCYLEAAAENIMFGGADAASSSLMPSDITFTNNYCFKPRTWDAAHPSYGGLAWAVKNNFELKVGKRVLVDGNLFENCWGGFSQIGFAIVLTVRNQDNTAPFSEVSDVTFTNNTVKDTLCGMNIPGEDDINAAVQTNRILIKNNFFKDIPTRLLQMGCVPKGANNVTFDHNTFIGDAAMMITGGTPSNTVPNFIFTNNILSHGGGFLGDGTGDGNPTLDTWFSNEVFTYNVIIGGNAANYPGTIYVPANASDVGFVNLTARDLRLLPTSPYKGQGNDGLDIGVVEPQGEGTVIATGFMGILKTGQGYYR